jgi:hypothetical protein
MFHETEFKELEFKYDKNDPNEPAFHKKVKQMLNPDVPDILKV